MRRLYAEIERKNDDDLLGEEDKTTDWGLWTSDSLTKFSQTSASGLGNLSKLFSVYLNNADESESSKTSSEKKNKE